MRTLRKASVGLFVVGIILVAGGIFSSYMILKAISKAIHNNVMISTPDNDLSAFNQWSDSTNVDDPLKYWRVYIYNMTNAADVFTQGSKPNLTECGPYIYREYKQYYNYTFSDDDNLVRYNERTFYTYQDEETNTLSHGKAHRDDVLTNLWVAYATAAKQQAGGDLSQFNAGLSVQLLNASLLTYGQVCSQFDSADACANYTISQWASLNGDPKVLFVPAGTSYVNPFVLAVLDQNPATAPLGAILAQLKNQNLYPEFGAFVKFNAKSNVTLDLATAQRLLYGPTGFFSPNGNVFMYLFLQNPNAFQFLTPAQASTLHAYFMATLAGFAKIGMARTPDQWLWKFPDPLLFFAGMANTNSALFGTNYSSFDEAYTLFPGMTQVNTGKDDVTMAQSYVQYAGYPILPQKPNQDPSKPGFWCNVAAPVAGHVDLQFPPADFGVFKYEPRVTSTSLLPVFVDTIFREVFVSYDSDSSVYDIDTLRFSLSQQSLAVDPTYSQYYAGLINFTCIQNGVPVMITQPHFYQAAVPADWIDLDGNALNPNPDQHANYLDVDPISGATLNGTLRLQLNYLMDLKINGQQVTKLIPLLWVEQASHMTPKQADDYKSQLRHGLEVQKNLMIALLVVGGLLAAISLLVFVLVREQPSNYEVIEEGLLHNITENEGNHVQNTTYQNE